jgi:O-antigen ligase/tetratricopeptide (TPR) repeat protein
VTAYGYVIADPEESNTRLDWALEALLIALLAFMPLAFGAVHAWSEQIVVVLAAAVAMVFGVRMVLSPQRRLAWSWAYLPVAVFLLVGAIQLVPLPASLISTVSPNTASLKTELLGDLPDSENLLSSMTLSFYPRATRHDLRLVLAAAAVFVVVVNYYRDQARIKRLLAAIAAIGGGIAVIALAQDVAGNGKIFWFVPTYGEVANSGPFINHSHYGQFMNLSIGAALALLLVRVHESFSGHRVTPGRVAEYFSSPEARTTKLLLAMVVLGIATVFVSLTRGGMLSMLIAAGFTTLMLSWRQSLRGRGWIMVLLALGAFICVLWVGFDEVYDRLASLQEINKAEGGRWQIVQDIALAWTKFPIFGVGLGTHEVVYPMFDRSTIASWAMHAENEYAQAAEETGLVGLLALVCFGIVVWGSYARSMNVASAPIRSAAYGLGFGLLAIQIHSLSDFGQHLPANAMLSAVSCGLLIALAGVKGSGKCDVRSVKCAEERLPLLHPASSIKHRTSSYPWLQVPLRAVALVLAVAAFAWAIYGADRARAAAGHWNKVLGAERSLEAQGWIANEEAYTYLFDHAEAATKAEPDNMHHRHWQAAYKWLSLTPYMDPNTGVLRDHALPWARLVVEDLHAARPLCPTFGATYCLAGEIEKFVLMDPNGVGHVHTGYRLAPCDSTACFAAARCDAEEGKATEAFEKLSRAVQLDGNLFSRAVELCIGQLKRGDLALALAGEDSGRLAYVGNALTAAGKPQAASIVAPGYGDPNEARDLAEQAKGKAFEQLQLKCEAPDAPASAHASLAGYYQRQGDEEAAIKQYQRALMKDYDQVGWHYALAQLLAQSGRVEDAIREARICLRLRPDHAAAKKLIEQLSLRPRTGG